MLRIEMFLPYKDSRYSECTAAAVPGRCRQGNVLTGSEIFHLAGWLFLKTVANPLSGNWEQAVPLANRVVTPVKH